MKRSLIWFKTDLRIHDNETLIRAINYGDQVIPVYCIDRAQFGTTTYGTLKTGQFRLQFLLESLRDLDTNLRKLGSGLIVVQGDPVVEIPKLASQYGVSRVYAKKEVAFEEKLLEEQVERALWKTHCTLETFSTSTLYHAEDLPFSIRDIPDVFTTFRKKTEKESVIRKEAPTPSAVPSPLIPALILPETATFGFSASPPDPRGRIPFKGGETAALDRLQEYFFTTKAVSHYKETRNALTGTHVSSVFSPWMAMGCLSPRTIYAQLREYEHQYGSNESTYWLYFELLWRDYFRFMMKKHRNRYFRKSGIGGNLTHAGTHSEALFREWSLGRTGHPFIDACMHELNATGFLSNRARQNVAAHFCDTLQLDWRYGAAYFEQQLIDYDVCSNWGNWAYIAGVGNDPRGKRFFNLEKQISEYDKDGAYTLLWNKGL